MWAAEAVSLVMHTSRLGLPGQMAIEEPAALERHTTGQLSEVRRLTPSTKRPHWRMLLAHFVASSWATSSCSFSIVSCRTTFRLECRYNFHIVFLSAADFSTMVGLKFGTYVLIAATLFSLQSSKCKSRVGKVDSISWCKSQAANPPS